MWHRFLALTALLSMSASVAMADHRPVYAAAERYRDVVKDFEREVFRADELGRAQRELADDLEDQTSRIRSEARDLDRLDRLAREYQKALVIQSRIEPLVFSGVPGPNYAALSQTWQRVVLAAADLGTQINSISTFGYGGDPYPPLTYRSTRPIYTQPYRDPYGYRPTDGYGVPTYPGYHDRSYRSSYPPINVPPIITSPPRVKTIQRPIYPTIPVRPDCASSPYRRQSLGDALIGALLSR